MSILSSYSLNPKLTCIQKHCRRMKNLQENELSNCFSTKFLWSQTKNYFWYKRKENAIKISNFYNFFLFHRVGIRFYYKKNVQFLFLILSFILICWDKNNFVWPYFGDGLKRHFLVPLFTLTSSFLVLSLSLSFKKNLYIL